MRPIDADALMDNIKLDAKKAIEEDDKVGSFWLGYAAGLVIKEPTIQPEPQWIPVSERLPSKEERKEWIDNNLDGIGYLYPCLVTRYSSINPDRTKNNPYVAKHYFDGEDFLNAGEEVRSEYIIAWMPLPEAYKSNK